MDNVYGREYYLAAGDATPQQTMPPGELFARCIEVATDHANLLGIGYDNLRARGQSWVLSRVAVEMERYPRVNETYRVETWVDSFNRAFSERCFRLTDAEGRTLGYVRSTWVAIDIEKRTLADISRFDAMRDELIASRPCPAKPCGRHRPLDAEAATARDYTFAYSDIDSNRHVNTVRYVELTADCRSLEFHDTHMARRIEVSFMRECRYGETASILMAARADGRDEVEFRVDGEPRVHFVVEYAAC